MAQGGMAIDPICGRRVAEDGAETAEYRQKTYYFCSAGCRGHFERHAKRIAERVQVSELARMGAVFATKKGTWGLA